MTMYRQPQTAAQIDWANQITRGLCVASIPSGGGVVNLSPFNAEKTATKFGSLPSVVARQKGLGAFAGLNNTNAWRLHSVANQTTTAFEKPSSEITILAFVERFGNNANGNAPIFGNQSPTTSPYTAWALYDKSGTGNLIFEIATGGSIRYLDTIQPITSSPVVLAGTYNGATQTAYIGGNVVGTPASVTGSISYPNSADRGPAIGNFWNYTVQGRSFNGAVYLTCVWNRALSATEIKSLSDNPWQLFQGTNRAIWVPVTGGAASPDGTATGSLAALTLTAATGTASGTGAVNGNATGSLAATTLSAATGTATGTATATGSLAAITETAATGSATGTATATAASPDVTLTAATGTANGTTAGNANASGSLAAVALTAATGTATGGASTSGAPTTVTLTAATGTASNSANGNAFATFMALVLTPPGATASGGATATCLFAGISLTPPGATASGAVTETVGRPTSDTSNTGWAPSTGVDLYPMVDEVVPDALDYIYASSVGAICEMALNATAYPGTASQALKYRASSSTGNSIIVRLKEGATTIRTETQVLSASDTEYTITLTSGEIAAITSGALSVELESA